MNRLLNIIKIILPSPFVLAIVLSVLTFVCALVFTLPQNSSVLSYSVDITQFWYSGFWGLLEFGMQTVLMLMLGHVLALSKSLEILIGKITRYCTNTANSAFLVALSCIIFGLINWSLGLIFGAIIVRKIGEKAQKENFAINYGLIGACGYLGLMVWHGGLAASAPLKVNEAGHFLETKIGLIPTTETIFGSMNIINTVMLIVFVPLLAWFLGKKSKPYLVDKDFSVSAKLSTEEVTGAERLDYTKWLGTAVGVFILITCAVFTYRNLLLDKPILTPNYINFVLMGLCFIAHQNIANLSIASEEAITGTVGVVLQFPLYAGIMGIMQYSGLIALISDVFVQFSNAYTLPFYTFLSASLINMFVPSGGGQWAIQGEIIAESALKLNSSMPKNIMAMAYGDELTNMLQPFWALTLLGISKLKARDIFPYSFVFFLAGLIIFSISLLFF